MHAGPTRSSISYDKSANCTGFAATEANYSYFIGPSGTFVYDWDSANRLVAVHKGSLHSEFSYDGYGRCVRIVEKNGMTVTSDKRFVWYGLNRAEERDGAGNVTKLFFPQGVKVGADNFFYTEDRLGNIREMTDNSGAVTVAAVAATMSRGSNFAGYANSIIGTNSVQLIATDFSNNSRTRTATLEGAKNPIIFELPSTAEPTENSSDELSD